MIIKATIADIPAIQQIACKTWPETYGGILSQEQIDYMLQWMYDAAFIQQQMLEGHQFYLLKETSEATGFIDVQMISATETKLHKIYLLPAMQGKGYGQLLINKAKAFAAAHHAETLILNVNRHNNALGFYQKNGFVIIEEKDIPIGNGYFMNDYILEWKVK